jgi:hypothetical protein
LERVIPQASDTGTQTQLKDREEQTLCSFSYSVHRMPTARLYSLWQEAGGLLSGDTDELRRNDSQILMSVTKPPPSSSL